LARRRLAIAVGEHNPGNHVGSNSKPASKHGEHERQSRDYRVDCEVLGETTSDTSNLAVL
jgi:hypothetical protein